MKFKLIILLIFLNSTFAQNTVFEEKTYALIDEIVSSKVNNLTFVKITALETEWNFKKPILPVEKTAFIILLCNKAYYFLQKENFRLALLNYEKATNLIGKTPLKNYDCIEFCYKPLGNLYTKLGQYSNAENTIKNYFYWANIQKNEYHKKAAVTNLSIVYQLTGKIDLAVEMLQNEINITENIVDKSDLQLNLANCFLQKNQTKKALIEYINIEKHFLNNNIKLEVKYLTYIQLAKLSKPNLQKTKFNLVAQNIFYKLDKTQALKNNNCLYLAEMFLQKNDLFNAKKQVEKVLKHKIANYNETIFPKKESLYYNNQLIVCFDYLSIIYQKNNQLKTAITYNELAIYVSKLNLLSSLDEETISINSSKLKNKIENGILMYWQLFQKTKDKKYIEKAFLLSENNKDFYLTSTNLNKEKLSKINTILNNLEVEKEKENSNIEKINSLLQLQNTLTTEAKLNSKIRDFELNDVLKHKEINTKTLICYFIGKSNNFQFILKNNTLEFYKLNITKKIISNFLSYFENSTKIETNYKSYFEISYLLFNQLNIPKNNSELLIIPDGLLQFIPFETFISSKYNKNNFKNAPYLLKTTTIQYQFSIQSIFNNKKLNTSGILGVFPYFKGSDLELSFSENEKKGILKNTTADFLNNDEANLKKLKKLAHNYSILHFCTHANSGSIYSAAQLKLFNEDVNYYQLSNLNIKANLIVLSACETGLGKFYSAESAKSIGKAFRSSGAQNILFSLWKINDFTTSEIMSQFYFNLKNSTKFDTNLKNAKLNFLENNSISNEKKSPYYWGALVYYGNSNTEKNEFLVVLGILFTLLVCVYITKRAT